MRVVIAAIIISTGIAGCQQQPDQTARLEKVNQENTYPPLTLSCKGTSTKPVAPPLEQTRIIDVPGSDRAGDHLSEYREAERLFYEVCPTSVFSCATLVNDDIIKERGFGLSSPGPYQSSMLLRVNRRTGRIVQEDRVGMDVISSFEGTCQTTEPPSA